MTPLSDFKSRLFRKYASLFVFPVMSDLKSRLFRKYAGLFVFLVIGVLLVSASVELFVGYQERRSSLAEFERERAASAALVIEQFINGIVWQLEGAADNPQSADVTGLERRRLYYLGLLKHVPALTDISYLDSSGKEQLRVSRIEVDVFGGQTSGRPAIQAANTEDVYFSAVYFRNESEPFMTIAVTEESPDPGVVVGDVNLKFIWDVISQIKIGETGYAYAVDAGGILVAHPNISLVLKRTDLSAFKQVKKALETPPSETKPGQAEVMIARDINARRVLTTYHPIEPLGWYMIVEQPLGEAFAPLYSSFWRIGFLMLVGTGVAVAASLFFARRMVTPIRALQANAARIGAGELDQSIVVDTGDELEELAEGINRMASRLQESYSTLEQKVEERTRNLINTQQLLTQVEAAKENERKTLGVELHDQTLADLAGLAVELGFLSHQASARSDELKLAVDEVRKRLRDTDHGLRQIVQGIYPPVLTIMGLVPAVNSFLTDLATRPVPSPHPLKVQLVATGFDQDRLEEGIEICLYRVIQQGLANVIQHARAKQVWIDLRWSNDDVTLMLSDNGVGFDLLNHKESHLTGHFGLSNLKDRIERFLGQMEIESQPGKGTILRAKIPVDRACADAKESRVSTHILHNQPVPQPID